MSEEEKTKVLGSVKTEIALNDLKDPVIVAADQCAGTLGTQVIFFIKFAKK